LAKLAVRQARSPVGTAVMARSSRETRALLTSYAATTRLWAWRAWLHFSASAMSLGWTRPRP